MTVSAIFSEELLDQAARVLETARDSNMPIVSVETCTAGLISACLTSVPGASGIFERGFVLYHTRAKTTGLGVPEALAKTHGAVSAEVTAALAENAFMHSMARVSIALTGYAGPGGGTNANPVGTVYISACLKSDRPLTERHHFSGNRDEVRLAGVSAALVLLEKALRTATGA